MMFIPDVFSERPVIFFDSAPELSQGYIGTLATRGYEHLRVAWTGVPQPDVEGGHLRVQWWTTDSVKGHKDYPLQAHETALQAYELLSTLPDVSRAIVLGYASQNPYVTGPSSADGGSQSAYRLLQDEKRRELEELGFEGFGGCPGRRPAGRSAVGAGSEGRSKQKVRDVDVQRMERFIDDTERAAEADVRATKAYSDRLDV